MKQILVAKTSDLELSGKKIVFMATKDNLADLTISKDKLTIVEFPLSMKVLQGDGEFDLVFTLPQALALSGVVLLGAYLAGNKVKAAMKALGGTSVTLIEDGTILEAKLVQAVSYKQVAEGISGGTVIVFGGDGVKAEVKKETKGNRNKKAKES